MRIRTVLVGLGWSGQEIWLPRLLARDDYEVVAAVDPDPARRAAFTTATGRPAHPDISAVQTSAVQTSAVQTSAVQTSAVQTSDPDIRFTGAVGADLAIVAVPNHAHAAVAAELLLRGIATFVEKPVCLSAAEADVLADAERRGGAPLLAGSAAGHRADVAALIATVRHLGQIRHVDVSWIRARGVPQAKGWFTDRAQAGGGVLFDLGWHLLDVLESTIGPVVIDRVAATTTGDHVKDGTWSAAWRHDQPNLAAAADVEDTVRAFLVTDSGISVGLQASWASHTATHDVTTIRVEGTTGAATLSCTFGFSPHREPRSRITHVVAGLSSDVAIAVEPIGAEYDRQLAALSRPLTSGATRGTSIARAHRIVTAIEAIYAAAADRIAVPAQAGAR